MASQQQQRHSRRWDYRDMDESKINSQLESVVSPGKRDIELEENDLAPINVALREDVPPDGGWGWVCTACTLLINANTWGVNAAWGIFLNHFLSNGTFKEANQLQYSLIGGLSTAVALFISPLVAFSNRKVGPRKTMALGTMLVSASMLGSASATETWQLFLSQGVCFGIGMGPLFITAYSVLPQWFYRRRSLAVGLAGSGVGIGGLVYNLGVGAAIESVGWRRTYIILAASTGVVNLTCSILLRDRNHMVQPKEQSFDTRELAHVSTWLIIVWGVFTELGYVTLLYSLPNYASSIGLSTHQGSVVGAMLSLGIAFGRPAMGYWSDTFGRINIATTGTAICGILCFAIWIPAKSYGLLIFFALITGTVVGVFWGTVVPVTAEIVGMQRLPVSFAMICLPIMLPTTFAEALALRLVSTSGYLSAQVFVGCVYLLGAVSVWFLRSWKMRELAEDERRGGQGLAFMPGESRRDHDEFWLSVRGLVSPMKV